MNNYYRLLLTAAMSVFVIANAAAQQKTLQPKDYMNSEVYPERINGLQWIPEEEAYSFTENNNLVKSHATKTQSDTLVTIEQLSEALNKDEKLKRFPSIMWKDSKRFTFQKDNKVYEYHIENHDVTEIMHFKEDAENKDIHLTANRAAFTVGQNLFVAIDGETRQITHDTVDGIVNGAAAHRREFGISRGTFWSNTGRYLAYYHMDESMVSEYPIVNVSHRVAKAENIRYPMAGMKSHEVKVAVYDTQTEETIYLDAQGEKEDYLTNITWSPDDTHIYVAELNRGQNQMQLNRFSSEDGTFLKTLFEETHDRYVEPEHGPYFLPNDESRFLWFSERDGYNHLYLYSVSGEMEKQLTEGEWVVQDIAGFSSKGRDVLFYATKNSPLNRDLFKARIKTGKISEVTPDKGTHRVKPADDNKYLIDQYSSMEMGRAYKIIDNKGKTHKTLLTDKDPMKAFATGEIETGILKGEGNTDLYYRLIKPTNFNPEKQYPVFIYTYGGPHAQLITNSYKAGARFFLNYIASQGYVVFTLDNRGSANRGFEFESIIHRNLGKYEMADQMTGVDYLQSLPYVDESRIGINGWSYGGFMSTALMLHHPEVFKVAVAGGPVIDWKYYEVMYGERYMDTPEENPEGYENSSLLNKAGNLDGRLLIIHGTHDPVVVWQHSRQFVKKCVEEGKLLDYFIYPGHEHNVRGPQRVHLFKKITQYFNDHL